MSLNLESQANSVYGVHNKISFVMNASCLHLHLALLRADAGSTLVHVVLVQSLQCYN